MKKSQLRKLIRESIKQLMTEQNQNYRYCKVSGCNTGFGGTYKMRIDGQPPVAGDVFQTPYSGIGTGALQGVMIVREVYSNWGSSPLTQRNFTAYTGPDCCPQACWHSTQNPPPTSGNLTGWGTPAYFTVYGVDPNPYVPGPNGMNGGCSSLSGPNCVSYGGSSTSGCDPSAPFPPNFNLQSWTNTWTSLPNFSSSNPNQPCNFVCQRRNQWTSQLAAGGMGPKQTNQVACKLAEAENQYQIHNCATSNANNCP